MTRQSIPHPPPIHYDLKGCLYGPLYEKARKATSPCSTVHLIIVTVRFYGTSGQMVQTDFENDITAWVVAQQVRLYIQYTKNGTFMREA